MVTITNLQIENVKRVKAVELTPTQTGLTVIGGKNGQGKTSVLDAIAWALGGERFRPSEPHREGSALPPRIKVQLSNGFIVERAGKNSDLKVTDPSGRASGQTLLNEFIEKLALDLPSFLAASGREKAQILLRVAGIGDELAKLDADEKRIYAERLAIGRIADQKAKFAKELPFFADAPGEPVSPSELIKQQQDILARNGENARKRARRADMERELALMEDRITRLEAQLTEAAGARDRLRADLDTAARDALELHDESTRELEEAIAGIDETNRRVRANLERERAQDEAKQLADQYAGLTQDIDALRAKKLKLLEGAALPLPGLSVEEGELAYNGRKWDCMSGAEQLKAATAIVRRLKPQCGFVLMDKLEQMDIDSLNEFGEWLRGEGLQAIATRVSTGEECSILISDGMAEAPVGEAPRKTWKAGEF